MARRNRYQEACEWIALNDSPADGPVEEDLVSYITVGLIADLFNRTPEIVAKRVAQIRREEEEES